MPSQRQLLEDEKRQTQARLQTNRQYVQELRQGEITAGVVEAAKARVEIKQREEQIQDDLRRLGELEAEIEVAAGAGLETEPECPRLPFEPEMTPIPEGTFRMGSESANESPPHDVRLAGYCIGVFPVTNKEYADFLKARPTVSPPARNWLMRKPPKDIEDHPVVNVSWREASAYCDWLNEKLGRDKSGPHYRLPTEAEWERAARGRLNTRFPWGDEWRDGLCNMGGGGTMPVRQFPEGASSYGCMDMMGNAEEWTQTIWGSQDAVSDFPYPYRSDDGREDPDAARYTVIVRRIVRGGSYASQPGSVTNTTRRGAPEEDRLPNRGFRVAMEIPPTNKV